MAKNWKDKKTWRKPYRGSRRFDPSCRSHGSCTFCLNGRLRYRRIIADVAKSQEGTYES